MNKKLKWAIPFAVLSLTCGVAAGAAGCSKHEHSYTQLKNDGDTHVMVCPDDDTPDESTREGHVYVAGECECGATEQQAEIKYGSVTGSVRLYKSGEYVSADGVKVEIDADADVEGSVKDGKYVYTIENVPVGESYELTISKSGYETKKYEILLEEEGEEATIGGANGITLNYEVFGLFAGWDSASHDLTHANDADPYILFREHTGDQTLNVITKDSYNGVSASFDVNYNNSTHKWRTQGIILKFSDGKHMVVRYHSGDSANENGGLGNIQFAAEAWNFFPKENCLFGEDVTGTQYGEKPFYQLSAADTQGIKSEEGVRLTTVVNDGKLTVLFGGKYICEYALPDGYADKTVQVAYFAFNAASNAKFTYEITKSIPALETALDINVTRPEGADCTVKANPQKDKYAFGEDVELTFTAPMGYKLDSLTIDGEDRYNDVNEGKLTIVANKETIHVAATFVKEEPININISVKGKKLGTTAALADGTKVTLGQTEFEVTNGAITGNVAKGRYTVSVDGYISKEMVIEENLTEIVFEYDLLENLTVAWGWGDQADFSEQNDGKITQTSGATQWVSSKDSYQSVAITANVLSGGNRQGVFIRFKGDTFADDKYVMIQKEKDEKVSWNGENNIWGYGSNLLGGVWTDYVNPLTDDDKALIKEGKYEVTLVRVKNEIYVFVNGIYKDKKVLDASYADMECYVGLYCTDANKTTGATRKFKIENASDYLSTVTVTDKTATDANGTIAIAPQTIVLGDTVEITVNPATGYLFDKLTVVNGKGETVATTYVDGKYTFIAAETEYTVIATFKEVPATEAQALISGVGLGNATVDMNGKTVSFVADGGATTALIVTGGSVKGVLSPGTYTVSVEGFYSLTATVGDDGSFENLDDGFKFEKVIFVTNGINEPEENIFGEGNPVSWAADATKAASEGEIKSVKDGKIYEWSVDEFDDVAITVTLKSGNGKQGLIMRFGGQQKDVRLRFEKNKAQWIGGSWWWGTNCIHDRWDFGTGSDYANDMSSELLEKYNGTGLKLTLARKGGMVYALIDGKIYASQSVSDFSTSKVRLCVFAEDAKNGYNIPFVIEDTDAVLAKAGVAVGEDLTAYGGIWTEDSEAGTLKVSGGRGYAEVKTEANTVKESVTIKIKGDVGDDQGIMYRFADGKYIAVRYQNNGGNYKVQYTMDTVLFSDGSLKGWTDFMMTDEEKQAFDASGLDLTFIRDGATFYTLLGDRLLDTAQLDGKYAEMSGVMGVMIWNGADVAFTYNHKTGADVIIPEQTQPDTAE